MKAISLWQPYLAGVLHGDGWCSSLSIGLRSKDQDFAETFAAGLRAVFGVATVARRDERGYWLARVGNKSGKFDGLKYTRIETDDDRAHWLRGMFDSEGNACLRPLGNSPNSLDRRVAFYTTDPVTRDLVAARLAALGITSRIRQVKASRQHIGSRPVFEIRLRNSRDNFARFADVVGSSIARKAAILDGLAASYREPFEYCSLGGRRGCATRWGTPA